MIILTHNVIRVKFLESKIKTAGADGSEYFVKRVTITGGDDELEITMFSDEPIEIETAGTL